MNIVEILKYCPKGTKLYSTVYGEVVLDHVCENGTHPIFCINEKHYKVFTKEGCLYENRGECILFPSREQRDWKKFKFPVKNGDIMMTIDKRAFIVNGKIDNDGCPCAHCGISLYHNFAMGTTTNGWTALFYIPASIEAMRELFNKMKKAGYRWNTETLELEKIKQVDEVITDFESARKALGLETDDGFRAASWLTGEDALSISKVSHFVHEINPEHAEALIALNKLFTIAQAWNKEDGFVPDFSDCNQDKWFPWFKYDEDAAGFVYSSTNNATTHAYAASGSRLCFKSSVRAAQFGKQFVDLYNKVFL